MTRKSWYGMSYTFTRIGKRGGGDGWREGGSLTGWKKIVEKRKTVHSIRMARNQECTVKRAIHAILMHKAEWFEGRKKRIRNGILLCGMLYYTYKKKIT